MDSCIETVYQKREYRITRHYDESYNIGDLKGDIYNPGVNPNLDPEKLKREEREFEKMVNDEGVYGYVLEKWNPATDKGWEQVDSCFGFVGFNWDDHYIIDEFKERIEKYVKVPKMSPLMGC